MSEFSEEFLAGIGAHAILKTGQVALAKYIAEHAHAHQVDKAGNNYISHPARVVENLISMPDFDAFSGDWQDFSVAAAWLHDVVEDTGENGFPKVTLSDLEAFGLDGYVVELVELLTRPTSRDPVEQVSYYERISGHRAARWVKWADIADNLNEQRLALLSDEQVRKARAKYAHSLEVLQPMTVEQRVWFDARINVPLNLED